MNGRTSQPLHCRARIAANRAHAWLYLHSGGRIGDRFGPFPVLVLETTGRGSGRRRHTPLEYQRVDGRLLVVGAAGGAPAPPAWWRNLDADGHVRVTEGKRSYDACAATVADGERRTLWRRLCDGNHFLEPLERKAGRKLPIVELTPR